jgi:hypothetical protein
VSYCRPSLHQNVIFGTTPISLIQPVGTPCLLAGNLRWSCQSAFDLSGFTRNEKHSIASDPAQRDRLMKCLDNSYPKDCASILLDQRGALIKRRINQTIDVKIAFEPIVCLQRTLLDLMSTAENCMCVFATSMRVALTDSFNELGKVLETAPSNATLIQKKSDQICDVLAVFSTIAKWAIGFVGIGDGHHALHVRAIHLC